MLTYLQNYLNDKKVLIFGYGREGKSTFSYLQKLENIDITIADENALSDIAGYKTISYFSQTDLNDYDVVFKSPGIVLKNQECIKCDIQSQTSIFLKIYKKQIIGITATKGKSTTSSLIYHILKENNQDCLLAGNIGVAMWDLLPLIKQNTKIVLELSCHQLEYVSDSPHIAILLNLYQEHLDHYESVEAYHNAKRNIYKNQDQNDFLIINPEISVVNQKATTFLIDTNILNKDEIKNNCILKGEHNLFNIASILKLCEIIKINYQDFLKALKTFKPLEHRLEYVGKFNEVEYYNDSISTIPETCINALKTITNTETILIGGMNRDIDLSALVNYLNNNYIGNVLLMYDTGKIIQGQLNNLNNVIYFDNLKAATLYAISHTNKGKAVVLSPASASYGFFKNFEERGNIFKQIIKENA